MMALSIPSWIVWIWTVYLFTSFSELASPSFIHLVNEKTNAYELQVDSHFVSNSTLFQLLNNQVNTWNAVYPTARMICLLGMIWMLLHSIWIISIPFARRLGLGCEVLFFSLAITFLVFVAKLTSPCDVPNNDDVFHAIVTGNCSTKTSSVFGPEIVQGLALTNFSTLDVTVITNLTQLTTCSMLSETFTHDYSLVCSSPVNSLYITLLNVSLTYELVFLFLTRKKT
jgi:hypothetical protein